MLSLSRKIKLSIERNLNSLIDKTYNETTIKELLIDLREIGNKIKSSAGKTTDQSAEKYDQTFVDFIDICNCIAHSNRLRGVLEKNIRSHIEKIQNVLNEGGNVNYSEATAVERVISGDSIVAAMLGTIFLYLATYEKEFDQKMLAPVFEDKADISLCIISLLQDTAITLENQTGVSLLHVLAYEGKYRLYCRVLNSSIQREARERTGGTGSLILGFPVVVTNAEDIDNLQFNESSDQLPKIIETYRDKNGTLHTRFVD